MSVVVFRCDGGDRVGAGHVARCLQLARAFAGAGHEVAFHGRYDGLAQRMLAAAGLPAEPPARAPAGIPPGAAAAVVDSYELDVAELGRAASSVAIAQLSDGGHALAGAAVVLSYHAVEAPEAMVAGPDYAPVDPRFAALRRERGFARALLSFGGSAAAEKLERATAGEVEALGLRTERPGADFLEAVAGADVAVTAAGLTPYELACAGVPTVAVGIAANQARVVRGLSAAGAAVTLDAASGLDESELRAALGRLGDDAERARLARAGPALVDGYGAFRARDALLAAFDRSAPPRVMRYRPASGDDSELLLGWRNDPEARRASRATDPVEPAGHERWLRSTLADPTRMLLVVEGAGEPIGTVRFDSAGDTAEISITVAPEERGRGTGRQAVREASELFLAAHPPTRAVTAEVREGNSASLSAFQAAGFAIRGPGAAEGTQVLTLDRAGLVAAG